MASISPAECSASQIRSSYHSIVRGTNLKENDQNDRYDFITFLETCQNLEIDFLPITWQPALDALGVGGQSEVRQSFVSLAMSFAFNRVKPKNGEEEREDKEEEIYRALVSQVSILRHPEIRNHSNILHLIGVCWDIRTPVQGNDHHSEATEAPWLKVWPVLVFEKTKHGDLNCFMRSDYGRNLGFTERLKLCIDIAGGIRGLHKNRVVHRDIKPHNVLVSVDRNGSYTAKIADLGYSIRLPRDSDHGYMPRSVPWEAPERHDRGHLFSEMVKMDIYSFGLVCLWFLFNEKLPENDLIFDALPDKRPHPLESRKQDGLKEIIERLAYETAQFSAREASGLVSFFRLCLASDQGNRASDISTLIGNLDALSSTIKATELSESSAGVSTSNLLKPFQASRVIFTIT
ncbi:hypothetical protein MMC30_008604 [Trapelia coarctata]|nr:hypothetical protein [Trapelia coarctata]